MAFDPRRPIDFLTRPFPSNMQATQNHSASSGYMLSKIFVFILWLLTSKLRDIGPCSPYQAKLYIYKCTSLLPWQISKYTWLYIRAFLYIKTFLISEMFWKTPSWRLYCFETHFDQIMTTLHFLLAQCYIWQKFVYSRFCLKWKILNNFSSMLTFFFKIRFPLLGLPLQQVLPQTDWLLLR